MTEITLTHGGAQATIALLGAEARQWRIAGRDLMWPGDPAIWSDISPILYPVVGWTRNGEERVDGRTYPLALHGFARFETFTVESSTPDFARLTLSDNARTRALYPFAFALAVEYRLSADALGVAIEVANIDEALAWYAKIFDFTLRGKGERDRRGNENGTARQTLHRNLPTLFLRPEPGAQHVGRNPRPGQEPQPPSRAPAARQLSYRRCGPRSADRAR